MPPDYVTRLMTVEEYEQMVLGSEDAMAVIMLKAKSCRPCRAFMKVGRLCGRFRSILRRFQLEAPARWLDFQA